MSTHEWIPFPWNTDAGVFHVLLNATMHQSLPSPERPLLLKVTVPSRLPMEEGRAHDDETGTLDAIEDQLISAVEGNLNAVLVIRLVKPQAREYYFHSDSVEGLDDLVQPSRDTHGYPLQTEAFQDPEASFYRGACEACQQQAQAQA